MSSANCVNIAFGITSYICIQSMCVCVCVYSPTSELSVRSNYFICFIFVFPITKKDAVSSNAGIILPAASTNFTCLRKIHLIQTQKHILLTKYDNVCFHCIDQTHK